MAPKLQLRTLIALLAVAAVLPACGGGGGGGGGGSSVTTLLVSQTLLGTPGNGASDQPSVSSTGEFIAFRSVSTNLHTVATTAARSHIYKKNMTTGAISIVSIAGVVEANGNSSQPAISPDGRWIAFASTATNMVGGITYTGGFSNIFLADTNTAPPTITVLSFTQASAVVTGNGASTSPTIAVTAGPIVHVAFESAATDLDSDFTYTASPVNVFLKRTGGICDLLSVSTTAGQAAAGSSTRPSISDDGQKIAFQSSAADLVAADSNAQIDSFVRDLAPALDTTTRVSVLNAGGQITGGASQEPAISGDGLHVVFLTQGTNVDVTDATPNGIYMRLNWAAGVGATTVQISEHPSTTGTGNSCREPVANTDGTMIAWHSASFDLVNGDTNGDRDVFRRNRTLNVLERMSLTAAGGEPNTSPLPTQTTATRPAISSTGAFVVFDSDQMDLVSPATTVRHVYRRG